MREKIRIACGQGFWGDMLDAPVRQVREGPIDYLMLDYLAEVTMSIMQKQRARDPRTGYARDFVPLMREILPDCVARDIRVTANAGGVNPRACAEAVRDVARELVPRRAADCRSPGARRAGRHHRARDRHGPHARAARPRVRLARGRLGQA